MASPVSDDVLVRMIRGVIRTYMLNRTNDNKALVNEYADHVRVELVEPGHIRATVKLAPAVGDIDVTIVRHARPE